VETTQAPNGAKVTKIRVNGLFAQVFLSDGQTNGILYASKDQITDTSALDFSYLTPDPVDPDLVILIQGAGEIPNSALSVTSTSAHLAVTTPFPVNRFVINLVTGEYDFAPTAPVTFDLTWTRNGAGSVFERIQRTETIGPLTIRSRGEYDLRTASVSGTWDGRSTQNLIGDLMDSQSLTFLREVTLKANRKRNAARVAPKTASPVLPLNMSPHAPVQRTARRFAPSAGVAAPLAYRIIALQESRLAR
jgi:hypothetical protein